MDILVNNAGITKDNLILRMTEEEYGRVLDTNLKGAFNTIRHLSRYFLKQRYGKIIHISSVSAVLGNAGQSNYSASKAGLIGLTKSVAMEGLKQMIPMGRIDVPEDVAKLAVFEPCGIRQICAAQACLRLSAILGSLPAGIIMNGDWYGKSGRDRYGCSDAHRE